MMYSDPREFSDNQLRMMRHLCSASTLACARVFFRQRTQTRFIVSPHHRVIAATLDKVLRGEIKRLIINIPPGYTKTELAVLAFSIAGFIRNPSARFMHVSYSADLARLNSRIIRETLSDPLLQALRTISLADDQRAKGQWATEQGGGFLAVGAEGQITGFRAGHMDKDAFTGALIIDDPVKPMDALSKIMRTAVNEGFNRTLRSRLAHEDVPIIVIMQRVHQDDLTGFLLSGGSGDHWHHLSIPAMVPAEPQPYPAAWTHGIPVSFQLPPGPLWPFKHNADELAILRQSDSFAWAGQYMQDPADVSTRVFPRSWFGQFALSSIDPLMQTIAGQPIEGVYVFADTAMKTGETNDYSVFQMWAKAGQRLHLLDVERGKWEAPELGRRAVAFLKRWEFRQGVNHITPRYIGIEDKASGTGLIQSLNESIRRGDIAAPYITAIPRNTDKVARALVAAPYVERGQVCVPTDAAFTEAFLAECEQFSAAMTHAHDDQVDPMLDAVHQLLIAAGNVGYSAIVG
jgi:predicted phage terminase large subunit-like protein